MAWNKPNPPTKRKPKTGQFSWLHHILYNAGLYHTFDGFVCSNHSNILLYRNYRKTNLQVITIARTSEKCYRVMSYQSYTIEYATFRTATAVVLYIQNLKQKEDTKPIDENKPQTDARPTSLYQMFYKQNLEKN